MSATPETHSSLVRQLRQALHCPCMKLCLRAYFDRAKAKQLLAAPPGTLSQDHRAKLQRFLRNAKQEKESGRWCVDNCYDFSNKQGRSCKADGLGRIYADCSTATLPKDVRDYIVTGVEDVDVKSSQPTMLWHACQQAGIAEHAPTLRQYVTDRDAVYASIQQDYDLPTAEDQKTAVNAVLNGGAAPQALRSEGQNLLHRLHNEAFLIGNRLAALPQWGPQAAMARKMKGRLSFLHFVMTHLELEVLVEMAAAFLKRGHAVETLAYDGVHVTRPDTGSIGPEVLRAVQQDILTTTGIDVTLVTKPMESEFTALLTSQPCEDLVDDDYAAGEFVKAYGRELFVFTEGGTWLFNKSTGQWDNSERSLHAAVHQHKSKLVFVTGERGGVANYGGDVTRMQKMLKMVPNHIEQNDDFFASHQDSGLGKLLFADGIYDFETDSFAPEFDPAMVFKGRIGRAFTRHPDPDVKAEVHKVIFQDPYTQKQLDEGVPLAEMVAFARALWGDYRARKLYFLVGPTSTGKGVRSIALKISCGSFVSDFNINSFAHNPNSGSDEAKQLSFLWSVVDSRIALSNEARS